MTFPGLHHGPRLSVLFASLGYLDFREMSYSLSFKSHFVVVGCLMDLCLKRDRFPGNILVAGGVAGVWGLMVWPGSGPGGSA